MKKILLILLLIFSTRVMAQETIIIYDEDSLPVLNEELRHSRERLILLEGAQTDVETNVTGILPLDNGGTGQDFSGIAEGDMLTVDSAGAMTNVGIGTSGYVWESNGTTGAWRTTVARDGGLRLIATGTIVSGTDIAIEVDKFYRLNFIYEQTDGTTNSLALKFNSDGGADDYLWQYNLIQLDGNGTDAITADNSAPSIPLILNLTANTGYGNGELYISTFDFGGSVRATIQGNMWYDLEGVPYNLVLSAVYDQDVVTSLEFLIGGGSGSTGTYYLYEYRLSI